MSYDINFWRQSRPHIGLPIDVYRALNKREPVDGLAVLPVAEIHGQLGAFLLGYDPAGPYKTYQLGQSGVEVIWSSHHFRFDIRGRLGSSHQRIVDVMQFFGCPLYDPQVNRRYDANEGMAIGPTLAFRDLTPEEEAEVARRVAEQVAARKARSAAARANALELATAVLSGTTPIHEGREQLKAVIQNLGFQMLEPFSTMLSTPTPDAPGTEHQVLEVCNDIVRRFGKGR